MPEEYAPAFEADHRLLKLLILQNQLRDERPDRMYRSSAVMAEATSIVSRVHRQGAASSKQLDQLEILRKKMEEIIVQ